MFLATFFPDCGKFRTKYNFQFPVLFFYYGTIWNCVIHPKYILPGPVCEARAVYPLKIEFGYKKKRH
jgi:hypothetical protein